MDIKNNIDIFLFRKAKICPNPKHKIFFNDNTDKYNPFSQYNFLFKKSFYMQLSNEFINSINEILIFKDLHKFIQHNKFDNLILYKDNPKFFRRFKHKIEDIIYNDIFTNIIFSTKNDNVIKHMPYLMMKMSFASIAKHQKNVDVYSHLYAKDKKCYYIIILGIL